jgi:uncharacterized membrane protein YccC
MTKDEELERLRHENRALREALQHKDTELEQSQQANQDLREGLKQAIRAIDSQQERVKTLEELIDFLQERVKTLERQQAKDSHNSHLPPSSDRFVRPPKSLRKKSVRSPADRSDTVGIISSKWSNLIISSFIPLNAVSAASTICVSKKPPCQSGVK